MQPIDRRTFLAGGAALVASPTLLFGQDKEKSPLRKTVRRKTDGMITPATQRAINRGLACLGRRQIARGRGKGSFGTSGYSANVAVCGVSGLAFMSGGSTPGIGPYGEHIKRCVDFLIGNTQSSGYISVMPGGTDSMYGHGFATLFLSEAYGMSMHDDRDETVFKKLKSAIKLIVDTQNDAGGWRYQPVKSDADLSITICQIMALRAARDAGIYVPEETRTRCIKYVQQSQNPDGGFRYTLRGGGSTFPLTAAGLVSLYSAGIYEGDAIEKGLSWLMRNISHTKTTGSYYFYGNYYAIQAAWHAGGEYWETWYPTIRDVLLSSQRSDGSWHDSQAGSEFGTAMACIILQMPNNFVPVFTEG